MILIMIMVYNNLSHLPLPPSPSSATTGTCEANDGANQVERTTWWDDSGEMRRLGTRDRTDFEIDVSSKIPGKVVKMKSMMKQTLFDHYFSRCAKWIGRNPPGVFAVQLWVAMQFLLGATTHATTAAATNGPEAWWLASRWRRSDREFWNTPQMLWLNFVSVILERKLFKQS